MSEANGANRLPRPAPIPPVNGNGAAHLDVIALQRRVEEIFTARMNRPMPEAPVLSETLTIIQRRGKPADVDVAFCQGEIERGHHELVKELRLRGIDPLSGEFVLRPLDAGLLRDNNSGQVMPQVRFQYLWAPHDKVEECRPKPPPPTLVT